MPSVSLSRALNTLTSLLHSAPSSPDLIRTELTEMEITEINGPSISSSSGAAAGFRSSSSLPRPNYSSRAVQEALEHLASIDLSELVSEAKVERCRAARDLSSCGRYVQHALNSCGHASLCGECCQRCDLCPVCRIPIPQSGSKQRLRLYDECINAGLISRKNDERFQSREERDNQLTADVQRLYSFFDVAMENNLVSFFFSLEGYFYYVERQVHFRY